MCPRRPVLSVCLLLMTIMRRPSDRALGAAAAVLLALACLWTLALAGSGPPAARAASTSQLQQQISAGQSRIGQLAGAVGAASQRVATLGHAIAPLERQLTRIQADLDAKRAELLRLQSELEAARTRLAQLEAFESRAEQVLSAQLVNTYESDRPDLVNVVLESRGFADLLERLSFASRIRHQDAEIVRSVRAARRQVSDQATRLGHLEARQQTLTVQVLQQRNQLARVRLGLVQQQVAALQARNASASQLAAARSQVSDLQGRLAKIEAAQAAQAAASAGNAAFGPIQVASAGGFTFPMPKGAASPPGSWSPDQGVDISAPGHTPLLAVGSGTIVLHGIGGFGPSAPVLHLDSGDYVYYGHAGPGNWVSDGTHVSAGQVIGEVGAGIVGISTGPHLEIGFCDSSGTPLGSGTAGRMMALLQAAYAG
jgi:murein DD-endopeptidase MepM/ murein hydrolase activator NlpD